MALPVTLPSNKLKAANSVVVPVALYDRGSSCHTDPSSTSSRAVSDPAPESGLFSSTHSTNCLPAADSDTNPPAVGQLLLTSDPRQLEGSAEVRFELCNCQKRLTVFLLTPWALAISRQLQWVMPLGLVCKGGGNQRRAGTDHTAVYDPGRLVSQTASIRFQNSPPPQCSGMAVDSTGRSDGQVLLSRHGGQDQPTPQRDLLRRAVKATTAAAFDPQPTTPLMDWFSPYPES